jgi:transposase InsO family protein
VVDHGSQFIADDFQAFVEGHGIQIRRGAVGEFHSLGLIDRWFRTLKESIAFRVIPLWNTAEFMQRLEIALIHYSYVRPHSALGGASPIERYYGIRGHLPTPIAPLEAAGVKARTESRSRSCFSTPALEGCPF